MCTLPPWDSRERFPQMAWKNKKRIYSLTPSRWGTGYLSACGYCGLDRTCSGFGSLLLGEALGHEDADFINGLILNGYEEEGVAGGRESLVVYLRGLSISYPSLLLSSPFLSSSFLTAEISNLAPSYSLYHDCFCLATCQNSRASQPQTEVLKL